MRQPRTSAKRSGRRLNADDLPVARIDLAAVSERLRLHTRRALHRALPGEHRQVISGRGELARIGIESDARHARELLFQVGRARAFASGGRKQAQVGLPRRFGLGQPRTGFAEHHARGGAGLGVVGARVGEGIGAVGSAAVTPLATHAGLVVLPGREVALGRAELQLLRGRSAHAFHGFGHRGFAALDGLGRFGLRLRLAPGQTRQERNSKQDGDWLHGRVPSAMRSSSAMVMPFGLARKAAPPAPGKAADSRNRLCNTGRVSGKP